VGEVAVAGLDDVEWGQRVVAWVVPVAGGAPTLDNLRAHVAAQMPVFCAPKELRLVDTLPRTALGKVQRHVLQGSRTGTGTEQ
jgi:acyl-CoA synthetase (AMP-forming)/AMP-acid ligase II